MRFSTTALSFLLFAGRAAAFVPTTATTDCSSTALFHNMVVISPPGGVGEVTAVKAAQMGSSVRWFIVGSTGNAVLSQTALRQVQQAGGQVALAGADVDSLLMDPDETGSALPAVSTWCSSDTVDSLVCTFDGIPKTRRPLKPDEADPVQQWRNAIKVAAREASKTSAGTKVAILAASDTSEEVVVISDDDEDGEGGLKGLVGGLFGSKLQVPDSLSQAMAGSGNQDILKLRHGEVFGTPESSPEFSALVGGPRLDPQLCDEYTMRGIRVDPTLSVSGNIMMGDTTRSSRHAVGEAAALLSLGKLPVEEGLDVCVSSQLGSDQVSLEEWESEFNRVLKMMASGEAAQLFSYEFGAVPDTERLADWLTTKWAPAVLRTYDIAAIRTGARPVVATRAGEGRVEIIWQELVEFDTVRVGTMQIQVTEKGLTATRGPGDASKGFGKLSSTPLAGESILVRRLAEAASQAIDKGLASRPKKKKPVAATKKEEPKVVSSLVSTEETVAVVAPVATAAETGPRQAGARRSKERKRRTRRAPEAQSSEES